MLWSHRQNVGRNELWASPAMAALGIRMLQVLLQKRPTSHWGSKSHLYLLLPAARNSNKFIGPFLAPFGQFSLSTVRRNLSNWICKIRRKMSAGRRSAQNLRLSLRYFDLRNVSSTIFFWNFTLGQYSIALVITIWFTQYWSHIYLRWISVWPFFDYNQIFFNKSSEKNWLKELDFTPNIITWFLC